MKMMCWRVATRFHGQFYYKSIYVYCSLSEIRLNSIKTSLQKTLRESDDSDHQANAEFDYTLAAVCEIPRHFNLSDWFGQKTWNVFFKPNYRQYNVKSVFLRYKLVCHLCDAVESKNLIADSSKLHCRAANRRKIAIPM